MIRLLIALWDQFWFTRTMRLQFGIFRWLLVAGYAGLRFALVGYDLMPVWAATPAEFVDPSLGARFLMLFGLPVPYPPSWIEPLRLLYLGLGVTALVGLYTRISLIGLALVNFYLESITSSFGFVDHATSLPSLVLFILAFAPGIRGYSLDALIVNWNRRRRDPSGTRLDRRLAPRRVAMWPARLILLLIGLTYFTAGVSKVRHGSWDWLDGRTLQAYLIGSAPQGFSVRPGTTEAEQWRDPYGLEAFVYTQGGRTLGQFIGQWRAAMIALAVGTVLFELSFIFLAFLPRFRAPMLLAGALFHGTIIMTMYLEDFVYYLVVYLLFIDWERLAVTVRELLSRPVLRLGSSHAR